VRAVPTRIQRVLDPDSTNRPAALRYCALKRMYMRCELPLPGMLARMPTDDPAASQWLTVAHRCGEEAALAAAGARRAPTSATAQTTILIPRHGGTTFGVARATLG
jgi:hypothetical protein